MTKEHNKNRAIERGCTMPFLMVKLKQQIRSFFHSQCPSQKGAP